MELCHCLFIPCFLLPFFFVCFWNNVEFTLRIWIGKLKKKKEKENDRECFFRAIPVIRTLFHLKLNNFLNTHKAWFFSHNFVWEHIVLCTFFNKKNDKRRRKCQWFQQDLEKGFSIFSPLLFFFSDSRRSYLFCPFFSFFFLQGLSAFFSLKIYARIYSPFRDFC